MVKKGTVVMLAPVLPYLILIGIVLVVGLYIYYKWKGLDPREKWRSFMETYKEKKEIALQNWQITDQATRKAAMQENLASAYRRPEDAYKEGILDKYVEKLNPRNWSFLN